MVESDVARAREVPERMKREQLEENPRGPKRMPQTTSPAYATATPGRSPIWCVTACATTYLPWWGRSRSPPCSSWGARREVRISPSPSVRPSRTRCVAAGYKCPIPAAACTGRLRELRPALGRVARRTESLSARTNTLLRKRRPPELAFRDLAPRDPLIAFGALPLEDPVDGGFCTLRYEAMLFGASTPTSEGSPRPSGVPWAGTFRGGDRSASSS